MKTGMTGEKSMPKAHVGQQLDGNTRGALMSCQCVGDHGRLEYVIFEILVATQSRG